ncbi:MAG: leucine-rich repeat protein, partial [Clostridia bacterium]|nr:leucine-rich repeat protein [Clostridia bacterium]
TIGENVGKIDDGTFGNCTSLKTIKIPDSVKTIGAYAFKDCSSLKEIAIPESVTAIGANAFDSCKLLGTAIIGNGVKTIGESAFVDCEELETVTIGKAVETIGSYAFSDCSSLKEIVIPKSVTEISDEVFCDCFNLKYIFFEGTEDSQKKLGDALVTNAKIHYGSSTHTFNENYTVDTEPTCTKKGSESQHCKYCDLTRNSRDVKENGHTSVNGGKIDVHTKCDVCGVTLSAEHEFTKTVIKAPTCTSQGVETWACECGYSETNNVEESDHNFVNHDGKVATCTEDGYYPYQTCTTCDYTTYHVDPAKGHDIVIDKAVEATCTKTGLTEGSHCSRCNGATKAQQTIAKKAHTEVTVTGKAATCTATGLTDGKKCSVCGTVTKAQETIKATGHTTSVINKKDATCTVDGYTGDTYCSVCKTTTVKGTVVKATGHKEVVIPEVAPTYTTVGKTEGKKCFVCGTITVAQKDVAKLTLAVPTVTIKNTAKGINVSWNKVNGAESYIVYRRTYNEKTKKWSSWSRLKTGVTATSYTDTTVKLGTKYRYTVKSVNGDVASKYISTSTLKYNVAPTVKVANASNGVKVSWSTVANATGYTVYSSTYNTKPKKWSGWKNRGTAKATATSWVDKNATKSGAYYKYTVRACNGKDIKSSYNKDGVKTLFLATPTVKIANNAKGVKVTWNKITGSKGYIIYRSEINNGKWSNWKNMGTVKNTILSWVDKNAQSGTTYRYTVRAVNGNYKSAYKASGSLIFLSQPTVKVANASNGIKVSWNKVDGITGYTVYSSTYDAKTKKWSSWKNRGTAKANKTSWVDKNVKSGVKYKYTVRAVNGKTKSTYVSSSALLYLAQPTVTVKATSNGINVSWTQCAGSNGYTVYRSELVNGEWSNWTNMGTAKSNKKSWTDKKAKKGVTYKYTVRAVNGKVKSSYKSSSSITK